MRHLLSPLALACAFLALGGALPGLAQAVAVQPAQEPSGLAYTNAFFPDARHDASLPTPESILGFAIGRRAASAAEIERCLRAWSTAAPERTLLVEYARSHEGRALHYLVVTAARNRARLEAIQTELARLADPRGLTEAEAQARVNTLPAVAWLAYCIHGDETEGSDAALALIHHLLADESPETRRLLEELIVIIDPLQNPDGRDRFLKMIEEHRGASANVDSQSLLHAGYWPRGRGNHYLFDLNRDWILATQPETRGRLREVARWNPLLFVDAHGMGGEDTYLFSPPREPLNRHFPANRGEWGRVFARDQARAFDAHGWVYYTGEWNEGWYPGYSDAWSVFRGAVGILYEVASIGENGVRRADGRVQTQRESIHQHIVSSLANLRTLQAHAKKRLGEFAAERRSNVDPNGPLANRTWAVLPTVNRSRLAGFADCLRAQGIELRILTNSMTVGTASDQFGRAITNLTLPSGTLLVANRQSAGALVSVLLDFDPQMSDFALEEERREILRTGNSRIYDVTAWNLTLLHGLEAVFLTQEPPANAALLAALDQPQPAAPPAASQPVGWVVDGADDRSVAVAARLMEEGFQVRAAEKPFAFGERKFARGSLAVRVLDNRSHATGELGRKVLDVAARLGTLAHPVGSGLGEGDLPDLGGRHFVRLEPPRIAVVGRGRTHPTDFGTVWHLLDQELGVRHSHLSGDAGPADLDRYNVIVLPERREALPTNWREPLQDWVKAGGTLIAIGSAAGDLASRTNELTQVRRLQDVLGKLPEYEQMIFREWLAQVGPLPARAAIWTNLVASDPKLPWPDAGSGPKEEELKKRDEWNRLFMPQGTILAARIDTNHWLTAGSDLLLPVLVGEQPVLMSSSRVETPARFGLFVTNSIQAERPAAAAVTAPAAKSDAAKDKESHPERPRAGWSALPEGHDLLLRMSGLLWPEAAQRIANAAVVTREPLGRGQVILFAAPPNFRAATRGTARILSNALVCGPGFGAAQPVRP